MITPVALKAAASLKKVAHLCLVNALCYAKLCLAMCEATIFTFIAVAILGKRLTELRLLEVRLRAQFGLRVGIATIIARTLAALEEVAHFRLREASCDRIVACLRCFFLLCLCHDTVCNFIIGNRSCNSSRCSTTPIPAITTCFHRHGYAFHKTQRTI
jgi:hypothetical protein